MMEKKFYVSPEMEEVELDEMVLLAGSDDGTLDPEGEGSGGDSDGEDY
jgi:hypothetical protein